MGLVSEFPQIERLRSRAAREPDYRLVVGRGVVWLVVDLGNGAFTRIDLSPRAACENGLLFIRCGMRAARLYVAGVLRSAWRLLWRRGWYDVSRGSRRAKRGRKRCGAATLLTRANTRIEQGVGRGRN